MTLIRQSRFITLEGGEGAGKSTVIAALRDALEAAGEDVVCTREPGGTPLAEEIRGLLLEPHREAADPHAELLLMFAARAQLVREVVLPALDAGRWVLSDRYTDASHAYQGGGRGQPPERIDQLAAWAAPVVPDLSLLLDLPVATGLARAGQRGSADRIEREGAEFFERVRNAYRERAAADPARFRVIDASQPVQAVRAEAIAAIDAYVAAQAGRA